MSKNAGRSGARTRTRARAGEGREPLRLVGRRPRAAEEASDHPARWTRPHVRTLAVASGKGGVGKSNLAANLAVALGARGARVLLLDADLAQANLDLLLGVHPRFDVQHVLAGDKSIEEILVEGPKNVTLVPAASGAPELAELDDYRLECLLRGLGNLETEADIILIDVASGVSRQVLSFCLAADEVMIVTTPEMPAFSDAYAMIKRLRHRGLTRAPRLVVNAAGSADEAEEVAHRLRLVARRFLKLELEPCGFVPFDPAVPRAVRMQEPVITAFPQAPASLAYRALAERLWSPPAGPDVTFQPLAEKLEA
ncbi:MAG: MinD/ParA family protein [Candidatus Eisenbacteria bacterium]|nr:MinD/ParA family protein [Candidatus Eisenbacteria bacterium]